MDTPTINNHFSSGISLVTRASQILAIIITFGLGGMISSILISENINDKAKIINQVSAFGITASALLNTQVNDSSTSTIQNIQEAQQQLDGIYSITRSEIKSDAKYASLLQKVKKDWAEIKSNNFSPMRVQQFTKSLQGLINHLQLIIKKEIQLLRIIQYTGFFSIILISYIAVYSLQNRVIHPLKRLLQVAIETGNGKFNLRADETAKGELGLLAKTLNDMSQQLSIRYQDLERSVTHKTIQLEQKNRSLNILYRSSHNLSKNIHVHDINSLITELEATIGTGNIFLKLTDSNLIQNEPRHIQPPLNIRHQYPINKEKHHFGDLIWETEQQINPQPWQDELLKAMANLFASFVDLQNKRHANSRLEIMEERAVIARELHDSLAQSLSYLKLQTSLLNKQVEKNTPRAEQLATLQEISRGTNLAYGQLREILTTFRLKLKGISLENSLKETIDEYINKCHHPISLEHHLQHNALTPHQEIHLLQIIREALSNIHKHAQASHASITIHQYNDTVVVDINDNGKGMLTNLPDEGHFGIKIMHERAKSLHGELKVSSNQPSGTHISLSFQSVSNK